MVSSQMCIHFKGLQITPTASLFYFYFLYFQLIHCYLLSVICYLLSVINNELQSYNRLLKNTLVSQHSMHCDFQVNLFDDDALLKDSSCLTPESSHNLVKAPRGVLHSSLQYWVKIEYSNRRTVLTRRSRGWQVQQSAL